MWCSCRIRLERYSPRNASPQSAVVEVTPTIHLILCRSQNNHSNDTRWTLRHRLWRHVLLFDLRAMMTSQFRVSSHRAHSMHCLSQNKHVDDALETVRHRSWRQSDVLFHRSLTLNSKSRFPKVVYILQLPRFRERSCNSNVWGSVRRFIVRQTPYLRYHVGQIRYPILRSIHRRLTGYQRMHNRFIAYFTWLNRVHIFTQCVWPPEN